MIKFFRKIRYDLMKQNKAGRYFKYAIGEIILVVIGILIALQINNANENRQERQLEIKYLSNLLNDLNEDLKNIEIVKQDKTLKISSALELIELNKVSHLKDVLNVNSLIFNVWFWKTFQPRNNTQQELISSGNLNIIKNDSIKNLLLDIKKDNEDLDVINEHIRREYDMYLYDPSTINVETLPLVNMKTIQTKAFFIETDTIVSVSKKNRLIKETNFILNNNTINNGLKLAIMNHRYSILLLNDLKANINTLITLIKNDLKK